jgi:hypothetical protein
LERYENANYYYFVSNRKIDFVNEKLLKFY